MKKTEVVSEILAKCYSFGDALEMLGYAMEFISCNMDIDEQELRLIISHTYGGVKCLADCQGNITRDIENFMDELYKELGIDPSANPKYREERLVWVYRHMDEKAKEKLDHYCDEFQLSDTEKKEQ